MRGRQSGRLRASNYIGIRDYFPITSQSEQKTELTGSARMHRLVYSVIFYLALPVILLRLMFRSLRAPAYRRRLAERFALQSLPGSFDRGATTFWIHAVSVGETVAAAPLVRELARVYPGAQIVVTTMTPTGSDRVHALFGESVTHCYIPYDLPGACNRFLDKYRPGMLILMETELWPNLVHACHRRGVRVLLANARLSEKSAAGYGRLAAFTRATLRRIDRIAAQATPDAERFVRLGAEASRVEVTGSLKFIIELPARESSAFFTALGDSSRPILVAASTREGEEGKVLSAFQSLLRSHPSALLLLIPRHPERFTRIFKLCEDRGFKTLRRSDEAAVTDSTQVVIGDSMGEMFDYYRLATIAFVGGSLVDTGCQNVLEPAALGIPVVVGPSQYNFATICKQLQETGALLTVHSEAELASVFSELLADEKRRREMGESGRALVSRNQNVLPALMKLIDGLTRTGG